MYILIAYILSLFIQCNIEILNEYHSVTLTFIMYYLFMYVCLGGSHEQVLIVTQCMLVVLLLSYTFLLLCFGI